LHAPDAVTLLIIALGAFLIPILSGRVGIPAVVGEILYGIAVGPQMLALIHHNEFTTFLAEFGFAFLMFLVGLELDFSRIERQGVRGVAVAMATAVAVLALAALCTWVLKLEPFLMLGLGAMSVGLMMAALAEGGLVHSRAGQMMILAGSIGEFLTIVAVTGFGFFVQFGFGAELGLEMAKLGAILVAAYLLLVVLRTLIWWHPEAFARIIAERDPSEIGVRAGMATMLVFVAFASLMGVEPILGAFVAGALFSFVFRHKGILETKLSSIGFGFFVPIFFIGVGAEFDLAAVFNLDALQVLGVLLVASLVAKLGASLLLLLCGMNLRESLGAGLLLATPLTLLVVIARIGEEVGALDKSTAGALVLLAIVTGVALPLVFGLLMKGQGATERP